MPVSTPTEAPGTATGPAAGQPTGRMQGRVAVITGASGGIGSATAERFVAEGAQVIAADIDDERGAELADALGDRVSFAHCDVADPAQVRAVVDEAVAEHGRIDVMFNNAATSTGGYVADLDLDGFDRSMKVMLSGPLYGMQAALPHMARQGGGSIVSTSSVYGLIASPANAPYCSAKAALLSLTRVAAVEYGRLGIRVNAICPGVVDTPMWEQVKSIGLIDEAAVAEMAPIGRLIRPSEIADLVLFLGSDESSAITGQAIVIDGGITCEVNLTGVPRLGPHG